MASRLKATARSSRLALGIWVIGTLVLLAGMFLAYQFVGPAPPKHVVLATGTDGGAYQVYGEQFAAHLAQQGIEVEIRPTAGALENMQLLQSESGVDVAFIQSGLVADGESTSVLSLGSLYFEPVWLFASANLSIESVADLLGKRIAIGAAGSGTQAVIRRHLSLSGIDDSTATLFEIGGEETIGALQSNQVDAAFLISGIGSKTIHDLLDLENARLISMSRAAAYARHASYLQQLALPEGILDLEENIPPTTVNTIAVTAMLGTREETHPAIVDLFMIAADEIFGGHSLLADAGEFPSPENVDIQLSEEAERFFERGAPFLMRYLPFWAATLVDRLWVLILPLIGLLIPLFKLMPPLYHWRIRRKILQRYSRLRQVDPQFSPITSDEDRRERLERIAELDSETFGVAVPKDYNDDIYKLRRDIDLVRRHLANEAS